MNEPAPSPKRAANNNPPGHRGLAPAHSVTPPPILCGETQSRIGGELISAGQSFDALGRLMLLETDADDETLIRILETFQWIEQLRSRISDDFPVTTAAERYHQ